MSGEGQFTTSEKVLKTIERHHRFENPFTEPRAAVPDRESDYHREVKFSDALPLLLQRRRAFAEEKLTSVEATIITDTENTSSSIWVS